MTLPSPICPTAKRHCPDLAALIAAKAPHMRIYLLCLLCLTNQPPRRAK